MANRQGAENFILTYIGKIAGAQNRDIYKNMFAGMSDKDFDQFMQDLESGKKFLPIVAPNFSKINLTVENNLKIGDELGHNFFEKVWIEGKDGQPTYLTPVEYMVVDLPLRRASQLLTKKISVPDHNKVVDSMTGQPTGESKGAKISYTELQMCAAMGLDNSMLELMKYRGGDNRGLAAFNGVISKYGKVRLEAIKGFSSGVESTKLLKTFLTCMMLKSNLI